MIYRNKCKACDYWTVFDLQVTGDTAVKTCTHCQDSAEIVWDRSAEIMIADGEKDIRALEGHFPVLVNLKNRGDHVRF